MSFKSSKFFSFLSLFSIISIALGVLTLIVALSLTNGLQDNTKNKVLKGATHAIVQKPDNMTLDNLKQQILSSNNWAQAEPYLAFDAMILVNNQMQPVTIKGENNNLADGQALISVNLKNFFNFKIGDIISIITPQTNSRGEIEPNIQSLQIVGLANDSSTLTTNVQYAHLLRYNKPDIQFLKLTADDINNVARYIKSPVFDNLTVDTYLKKFASLFMAMELEKFMISLILCFLIALASLNIISLLVILVTEKQADIAILRTIGTNKSTIAHIFITWGLLIGLAGMILGLMLGLLLAFNIGAIVDFLNQHLNGILNGASQYFGGQITSVVKFWDVFYLILWTTAVVFLSTLYPAYKASQIEPAISVNK